MLVEGDAALVAKKIARSKLLIHLKFRLSSLRRGNANLLCIVPILECVGPKTHDAQSDSFRYKPYLFLPFFIVGLFILPHHLSRQCLTGAQIPKCN